MKNKSMFRIFGLFALVGLLFGSSYYVTQTEIDKPDVPVAQVIKKDSTVAVVLPAVKTEASSKSTKSDAKSKVAIASKVSNKSNVINTSVESTRACVVDYMLSQVGVREKTNKNDGKRIYSYFKAIGWENVEKLKPYERPYCGAFMATAWLNCMEDVPFVESTKELAQVKMWEKGPTVAKREAEPGDTVSLKGWSHVQGVADRHPNPTFAYYTTVTANSSPLANDTDLRGGVFKKTALWRDVKKVISVKETLKLV